MTSTELICTDCGLPIAGERPRTDVTRYLAETSRCQCKKSAGAEGSGTGESGRSQSEARRAVEVKVGFSLDEARQILEERFELLEFLGQGGMGSVYKVKDKASSKVFAVKLLNPQLIKDENSVRRFEQEAKAAMHLTHAHLTAVYEYGIGKEGVPFLVMDYLEGATLDQIIKKESYLDNRRALDLFIQIAEAIQYAHSKGVIHRDIKPNNIIVSKPENSNIEFAKLFDFGIAKVLPNQAIDFTQDMTETGELLGSPLYMSPEQCKGLSLDGRTDIYSFGCVMYKTLTGKHPFEGKNFVDTVVRIITTEAPALSSQNPQDKLPSALEELVHSCIDKNPEQRYKTAAELQADLERVRDGKPILKAKPKSTARSKKIEEKKKSEKQMVAAVLGILAILAASAMITSISTSLNKKVVTSTNSTTVVEIDPYKDAERLDSLSYTYFVQGKYEQAIPLLEFGIKTYKENGKNKVGAGREDNYLAENYSHLGKCFLMLKRYKEAVPSYREALRMFQKWGNYKGGMMSEAVNDYATVLKELGQTEKAEAMLKDYSQNNNLTSIPEPE